MSSKYKEMTANSAENEHLLNTDFGDKGVSIIVTSDTTLGGGTLSLRVKPAGSSATPEEIGTLTPSLQEQYHVGSNMEVYLHLSGATSPSVKVMASTLPG